MRRPFLVLLVCLAAPARADLADGNLATRLPEHHAQDPHAAVVTERNLLASERFWPYQVALTGVWQPPGAGRPLEPDASGVLIRVEPSGLARVDFGRDGLHDVPVARTDLLANANRVRLGQLEKLAPNFLLAIGPRLVDAGADSLRPFPLAEAAQARSFLCVFADPEAPGFAAIAGALAPLQGRDGLLTLLFPQGAHPDAAVRERLRSLHWTVPFVYDHLAEAYTATLLDEATPPPAVLLQSREGRLRFQGRWRADLAPALGPALAE